MPLLSVESLRMYYQVGRGFVKAVDGVSFNLGKGETLGIAGESGCGKSSLALTLLRILPSNARIIDGSVLLEERDILKMNEETLRKEIRWKRISIVFQGAMNALNPVFRVGDQIAEAILLHEDVTKEEAHRRARELLKLVGIPPSRADNYPHEFSGGMKQRVMIAMALACNPDIVIADEPTTALDVIVQAQILKLLKDLRAKLNLSLILITHDLSIISEICDKVAIMYAGKIMEYGSAYDIFKNPLHPYTQGLIAAIPSIRGPKKKLRSIPGTPPDLLNPPSGCPFHPRCPYADEICRQEPPPLVRLGRDRYVVCHKIEEGSA
ncbi:MAG: ABC transporter ATP-binding protein [Thermoprotei archaeon]|nr:ABC transporter ATP-binding protein [Thermoprotei archaeon]